MSEPRPIKALVQVLGETLLELAQRIEAEEKASQRLGEFVDRARGAIVEDISRGTGAIGQALRDVYRPPGQTGRPGD